MKKLITLFMAVLLCFGFIGCSNESSDDENEWVRLDSSNMFDYVSGTYAREYSKKTKEGSSCKIKETYAVSALGGAFITVIDVYEVSKSESFASDLEELKASAEEDGETLVYDEETGTITETKELDILTLYLVFTLCNGESNKAKTKFKITDPSSGDVAVYTKL